MWVFVLKDSGWAILNMTETFAYIHSLYLALVVLYIYWFSDDFIFVLWDTSLASWRLRYEDWESVTQFSCKNTWPSDSDILWYTQSSQGCTITGLKWKAAPVNEVIDTAFLLPSQLFLKLAKDGRGSFYDCRYRFPLTDELGSVSSIFCT